MGERHGEARYARETDNFRAHCLFMLGVALGIAGTAFAGWPWMLGWALAWGSVMGFVHAWFNGYLSFHNPRRASGAPSGGSRG